MLLVCHLSFPVVEAWPGKPDVNEPEGVKWRGVGNMHA
jgi:hypothetical protein